MAVKINLIMIKNIKKYWKFRSIHNYETEGINRRSQTHDPPY